MNNQLERLSRIYNRLRRGPVTIEIISAWARQAGIEISDRQLYRDLSKITQISFFENESVVEYINENNKKTWKLEYSEDSDKLNSYDINTFFLMKNFTTFTAVGERQASIEKFEKFFYKHFSKNNFQQYIMANSLYMRKTGYGENLFGNEEHQIIEDLIWVLQNNRKIIIENDPVDAANFQKVIDQFPVLFCPLELICHKGRVHVSGFDSKNQLLIFAIAKDFKFSFTNDTFNRKKYLSNYEVQLGKLFGISKAIEDEVYNIKLEFTKSYGSSQQTISFHPSQRWESMPNGNMMLHLECALTRELVGYIAYGLNKIKVHQPKKLQDLIIQKYRDSIAIYDQNIEIEERLTNAGY